MTAWTGWDEDKVRRQPSDLPTALPAQRDLMPTAIEFTAINAPSPSAYARIAGSEASRDGFAVTSRSEQHVRGPVKSLVSDYLGRGVDNSTEAPVKQASGPLRGHGTKKAGGKGKKRAANSRAQPQAKRRKKSDVSCDMPVAKSSTQSTATKKVIPLDDESEGQHHSIAGKGKGVPERSISDAQNGFVSIFAPRTSMTSLQTASQPTSFESVQPSAVHPSTTLYDRQMKCGTSIGQGTSGEPDIASLRMSQMVGVKDSSPMTQARKVTEGILLSSPATVGQVGGKSTLLQSAQQIPSRKRIEQIGDTKATQGHGRASQNDPSLNDYLAADDDDVLSEILDLVDRAEAQADREQVSRTPNRNTATNIETSKRRPTILLTPDEEFMHLADFDEDTLAECWMAEEPASIERSPTPPYRDRKLNLRDVDPHEDYGGALLSDADQRLLGMAEVVDRTFNYPLYKYTAEADHFV